MMEILELYVNPFVKTTLSAFKEFAGINIDAGAPCFSSRICDFEQDISSVIGLSGDIRGAVVLTMKKAFAIKITDALVGTKHTDLDEDVVDAMGEMVNVIAGNVKQYVEGGEKIEISLPTVIKGRNHTFAWPGKYSRILYLSFKHEDDTFYLMVDMEKITD